MKHYLILTILLAFALGCSNSPQPGIIESEPAENFVLHVVATASASHLPSESGVDLCYSYSIDEIEGYSMYVANIPTGKELAFEIPKSADKDCVCIAIGCDGQSNGITAWVTPGYGRQTGGNFPLVVCGERN